MATRTLRIGTREPPGGGWEGVLRADRKVILGCGHHHHNRDQSTQASGQSARHCITTLLAAARNPGHAATIAASIRTSMNGYIRTCQVTTATAARYQAEAAAKAATFLASLPVIAELIGNEPVYGYAGHIAIAPVPPADATCRYCGGHIEPQGYAVNEFQNGWFDWRAMPGRDANCPPRGPDAYRGHQPA